MSNVGPRHDLEIRLVQPSDFDQWQALWDGYNAFYGRKDDTALPSAITGLTWSRFFDAYEPMHAFVAVRNETLFASRTSSSTAAPSRLILSAICAICTRLNPHAAPA